MDEPGRKEPHAGENPYAYSGAADTAANAAAQRPAPAAAGGYPVEFTAAAGDYFRIWIVNLALTILTLGIYSAWAKVRKKRYFYSHTLIDGDSFEYRAVPLAILKGRLIAVGALALFYGVGQFAPSYKWALFVAGAFALPWLLVRSMAFNAYNSAYRNVRLHFRGTDLTCLGIFAGYALLMIVTLGLAYPYMKARLVKFAATNHRFGTTQFEVGDLRQQFRRIFGNGVVGIGLLTGVAVSILQAVAHFGFGQPVNSSATRVASTLVSYAGILLILAYSQARYTNATFDNLTLGPVRFESMLRVRELYSLYVVNVIAIIFTLGLATPWAAVRAMRYRAEHLALLAAGGLPEFVSAEADNVSAAGEEVGEMFDIDFGL
jgi:uncharacterized membrane protein YjgN (DUF898 family)